MNSNYTCIDRQVVLPNDADVSFIGAEYKDGILCIIIPKSVTPVGQATCRHCRLLIFLTALARPSRKGFVFLSS